MLKLFKKNSKASYSANEELNVYENVDSTSSFKSFYEDETCGKKQPSKIFQTKLNCMQTKAKSSKPNHDPKLNVHFRTSKFRRLIGKYFSDMFDSTKLQDRHLDRLAQILDPLVLNQLNQIINSPNIDKLKTLLPLIMEKENENQNLASSSNEAKVTNCGDNQENEISSKSNTSLGLIKVADKIKKFNELIDSNRKNELTLEKVNLLIPKKKLAMSKFKEELSRKLEQKFKLDLPTLNSFNSNKSASSLYLAQTCQNTIEKASKSLPLIKNKPSKSEPNTVQNEVRDRIELVKMKTRDRQNSTLSSSYLKEKEIKFNDVPKVYSFSFVNLSNTENEFYDVEMKIIHSLREIYKVLEHNHEDKNVPIDVESMNYQQLREEKFVLEKYLFKLDFALGKNKFLLNNQLYLKLIKRYNLIRALLDGFKCDKCGKKNLIY